jgi:hypothetical protein
LNGVLSDAMNRISTRRQIRQQNPVFSPETRGQARDSPLGEQSLTVAIETAITMRAFQHHRLASVANAFLVS